jgi:Formate--tetrahydrofolate ligase
MASSSKTIRKQEVVSPVPTDIDIANSVQPLPISEIAETLNLSPEHYDLYGKYKAKVEALLWNPPFFHIWIFCSDFFIQGCDFDK